MTDIAGWLPDGEHIVVSRRVPGGTLLQTLNIHTGVLSDKAEINNLKGGFVTLSPDGSQIAGGGGPSSIGRWRGIPYNPAYATSSLCHQYDHRRLLRPGPRDRRAAIRFQAAMQPGGIYQREHDYPHGGSESPREAARACIGARQRHKGYGKPKSLFPSHGQALFIV